jgi:hypothetical protein
MVQLLVWLLLYAVYTLDATWAALSTFLMLLRAIPELHLKDSHRNLVGYYSYIVLYVVKPVQCTCPNSELSDVLATAALQEKFHRRGCFRRCNCIRSQLIKQSIP